MPHVDIELEDNKQFISNIPRRYNFVMNFVRAIPRLLDSILSVSRNGIEHLCYVTDFVANERFHRK